MYLRQHEFAGYGKEGIVIMGITAAVMLPHPPLIIPEIGRGEEKKIQKTVEAYHKAAEKIGAYQPDTIVLISPHQVMYADYFHISPGDGAVGDFSQFRAAEVKMELSYDAEFVRELCRLAEARHLPAGTMGERDKRLDHGTMVPLYFVNQCWRNYRLVRIGLSGESLFMHYELGKCIKEAAAGLGRNTVVIGSGDLSHRLKEDGPYGYQKEGPEYDRRIMDVMGRAAFGELFGFSEDFLNSAGECGHRSFTIMAGALDRTAVASERLSYEGPFGVGYGICTYEAQGQDDGRNFADRFEAVLTEKLAEQRAKEDAYVRLAHNTVEAYVRTGKRPAVPEDLSKEMYELCAGVFVSIKKQGKLRGCIGTIAPVYGSIAQEIIENAVSASSRDPRFSPIEPEELKYLTLSVDVLGEAERITSAAELDVKRYGVIVTKGSKRGLLLPNLEGVDTVADQIAIAKQKAGIREDDEDVELERFEVTRHF